MGKDLRVRFFVIFTIIAAATLLAWPKSWFPILGPDLKGGRLLIFQVNTDEWDKKIKRIANQVEEFNGMAWADIETWKNHPDKEFVTPQGIYLDENGDGKPDKNRDANGDNKPDGPLSVDKVNQYKSELRNNILAKVSDTVNVVRTRLNAKGVEEVEVRKEGDNRVAVVIPGVTPGAATASDIEQTIMDQSVLELRIVKNDVAALAEFQKDPKKAAMSNPNVEFKTYEEDRTGEDGEPIKDKENLLINKDIVVSGVDFENVQKSRDQKGDPQMNFRLTAQAGIRFKRITRENKGERLAVLLNGVVRSAPKINDEIGREGVITGKFTDAEVERLIAVFRAGSLPLKLDLVNKNDIGPSMGKDSINSGVKYSMIAVIAVIIFMLIYYAVSGLIANVCLILNLILIIFVMTICGATLTMPGIAGIVLTLGMAVDANVLINERIREELRLGKGLADAVRNGFDRAFVTIVDANLTTIITAFLLFNFGSGPIKGFAITITLGLLISMFTAVYVARTITEYMLVNGWVKKLHMLNLVGVPSIKFTQAFPVMFVLSTALSIVGAIFFFTRGNEIYDSDFKGGMEIHVAMSNPFPIDVAREMIEKADKKVFGKTHSTPSGDIKGNFATQFLFRTEVPEDKNAEAGKKTTASGTVTPVKEKASFTLTNPMTLREIANKMHEFFPENDQKMVQELPVTRKLQALREANIWVDKYGVELIDVQDSRTKVVNSLKIPDLAIPITFHLRQYIENYPVPASLHKDPEIQKLAKDGKLPFGKFFAPYGITVAAANTTDADKADYKDAYNSETWSKWDVNINLLNPSTVAKLNKALQDNLPAAYRAKVAKAEKTTLTPDASVQYKVTLALYTIGKGKFEPASKTPEAAPEAAPETVPASLNKSEADLELERAKGEISNVVELTLANNQMSLSSPIMRSAFISATVGAEMWTNAKTAFFWSIIALLIYLTARFQFRFSVAAVIATFHDIFITLGFLAAWDYFGGEGAKFNLTIVAALLTLSGFSMNDTVVVFDRIRENLRKRRSTDDLGTVVDSSVNQTLSRTLLTSATVFLVVATLLYGGVGDIYGFALTMCFGVLIGTYSSIFIASPVLVYWQKWFGDPGTYMKKVWSGQGKK